MCIPPPCAALGPCLFRSRHASPLPVPNTAPFVDPFLGSRLAFGGPRSIQQAQKKRKARQPASAPAAEPPAAEPPAAEPHAAEPPAAEPHAAKPPAAEPPEAKPPSATLTAQVLSLAAAFPAAVSALAAMFPGQALTAMTPSPVLATMLPAAVRPTPTTPVLLLARPTPSPPVLSTARATPSLPVLSAARPTPVLLGRPTPVPICQADIMSYSVGGPAITWFDGGPANICSCSVGGPTDLCSCLLGGPAASCSRCSLASSGGVPPDPLNPPC
ncbi:hypothetical protein PBY51_002186 [Eleginops maclovinus]|uniref:Uncharacterized protein n=1 Tax=Eleginops maclovinus TaxID=56733 RepID=A0AAN7WZG9_ELEMC|nr:hypothetical protein PBY51_002186 [Eleginops maclovinus]